MIKKPNVPEKVLGKNNEGEKKAKNNPPYKRKVGTLHGSAVGKRVIKREGHKVE